MVPHTMFLYYLGLVALGLAVGGFGTLIGAGGGFVLMPVLLLLYPKESPSQLTAISLAVVFFNALSGSGAYARMKRIDYQAGWMFALATVPGAIIGALTTSFISRRLFDLIFGIFMIVIGAVMFAKPKSAEHERRRICNPFEPFLTTHILVGADGCTYRYTYNPAMGVGLSFFVGYLSSFLGIGGGIVHVPAMAYLLHFPVHVATATSHFVLAIMALAGSTVHLATGAFHHGLHRTVALGGGVVGGAQFGAFFSNKIKGQWIIRSLALALTLVGIRIILAALA